MASRAATRIHQIVERIGDRILIVIFHPSKMMSLWDNIQSFNHLKYEPLYETWLRFKKLVLECPTHGLPDNVLLQYFY